MLPLGDGCRAHRLDGVPALTEVPAPVPGPELAAALGRVRAELPGRGMFDGPIAVPVAAGPDGIAWYRATYAWNVVQREGVAELPAGRGIIAVAVLLHDGAGRSLWQLRSDGVAFGGRWDITAAGAWHPGEDLQDAALREAHEELGCPPGTLGAPDGRWLTVGPAPSGATLVLRIPVEPATAFRPDPAEVAELRWAADPADLPAPGLGPVRHAALRAAGLAR
ncbi:MAG: NUDIX domain-containing protein [Thermoleophilia bacterium]